MRHVADIDHRVADDLDRQVAQRLHIGGRTIHLDRVFEAPDLLGAYRVNEVLRCERVGDILCGQPSRLKGRRIEIDLDLPNLATEGPRHGGAGNGDDLRAQRIDAEVEQLLLRQPLAREGELHDWHCRGVVVQDQGWRGILRQLSQHCLRDRGNLRIGHRDVHVRLKEHLDDADAHIGVGIDALDIIDRRRQRPLKRRGDARRHLLSREASVLPHDTDHGDTDLGKNVDWGPEDRQRSRQQDKQGQDHERVRPLQRNADEDSQSNFPRRFSL